MDIATVGDLKAALADVPDETPLARPASCGGFWTVGQLQVGYIDLIEVGHRKRHREVVAVDGWMDKTFTGWRGRPYRALAFG